MTAQASNWESAEVLSEDSPSSIIWAGDGDAGGGKSHFALTAPGPIWVAAFDPYGMDRVSKDVKVGKDIRISRYPFNPHKYANESEIRKAANELWKQFTNDYADALAHARSIIWDREDMAFKMQRYSNWGGTSAAPKDYEDLYIEYVGLIQGANAAGVNLGLLRGLKEKWVTKYDAGKGKNVPNNTGDLIADGMRKVPDHVDVMLFHRWDEVEKQYVVKIGKFTNPDFRSMEMPLDFPTMASAAYPDSDASTWL